MQLSYLLESINVVCGYKEQEVEISNIAYHSGKVKNGDLFVCIKGYKVDGHNYLQDAVDKGAIAAIVEEINETIDLPQYVVENSREALAKLSATYFGQPSKDLQMIGITATNGKTTTSFMANAILESHQLNTGLIGTINIKMGDKLIPSELTTPESLELQGYLDDMNKQNISHVIMEVSSAAQEMHRVDMVDYDIVTLNNINREHIDTHGTFENYVKMKTTLIKNAKRDSMAIMNLDCPYTAQLLKVTKATPVTFSVDKKQGDFYCKNLDLSTGRAKFTIEILNPIYYKNELIITPSEFDIELTIPGLHSVSNAMIAIMIAILNKVPISTIQKALGDFEGVDRRFEFIYEEGPIIIDDHFANPGNIEVTLETLSLMKYNKLHVIYAIRGQRGETVNRENAETVVKWAEKIGLKEIIVTESVEHVTSRDLVTAGEAKSFMDVMEQANIDIIHFKGLPEALKYSLSKVTKSDLLLLAGCQGMDDAGEIVLKELKSQPIKV